MQSVFCAPLNKKKVGEIIVEGIWNGISDMGNWFSNKIGGFIDNIFGTITGKNTSVSVEPEAIVSARSIPGLATGAVIPPNKQFLAMLGDQKAGRNLEAPEGLIRQIVREESGDKGVSPTFNINFTGRLSQLGRVLYPVIEEEKNRVGSPLTEGGSY